MLEFDKQDLQLTGFSVTHTEIKDLDDLPKIEYSCFVRVFHKRRTSHSDFDLLSPLFLKKQLYAAPKNNQFILQ